MTAKVMDIISRLPGCEWTSWCSICLNPSQKGRCANNWKFPSRSVQKFGFVHHDTNGQKSWSSMEDPSSSSWTESVILSQDYYGKSKWRKSFWNTVGRKFQIVNVSLYIVKKGHSHLRMWMTLIWLERNNTLFRCGNCSTKKSIWENQHLSLIMHTWDVLNDNEKSKDIVDKYRAMFESRISAGSAEKFPYSENLSFSSLSCDIEGHAKKCVERYCEVAHRTTQ